MQTLDLMRAAIQVGAVSPLVRQTAALLIRHEREYDVRAEASALLSFVQNQIRYTADIRSEETLHGADFILENRYGDCDDKVIIFCALCESIGIQTCIFAVGDSSFPTHVMAGVFIDGGWLFAETCNIPNGISADSMPLGWRPANMKTCIKVDV